MKWKLNVTVILSLLLFSNISAQTMQRWVEMMHDPNVNFYEVQAEFNSYWAGKTIEKGKGYKAFRRWEAYMAPRVYPTGDMSLPSQTYTNYRQWELAQAAAGIPKSTSGNWTLMGPTGKPTGGGAGRLNFIRFDPSNSSIIYVGAPDGGLWKSTDAGATWTTNTDQLSIIGVSDLAIDPTNSQTMYLATGDSDGGDTYSIGVLKSTDGGVTWNTTGLTWTSNQYRSIGRLLINPTNPSILMAFSNAGIFRTTNGGTSWSNPTGSFGTIDAEFKPGDPNTVYASGTSIKRSTDGGVTWTAITTSLTNVQRIALAVTAANSAYVYALATESTNNGFQAVLRSTDSGASFTTRMSLSGSNNIMGWDNGADTGGQGWYDVALAASPTNAEEVYTGGVNMWKSTNGGTTFTLNSHWTGSYSKPYVHADIHDIQFLPGSGTTVYSACDGGIFRSTNSGSTYTDISNNLAIAQQYRIGLSTSNATLLVSGHQDNGTNKMNGTTWTQVYGGDGMEGFIDRTNNNVIYGSYVYGDYYRSSNGGTSWTSITTGLSAGTGSEEWLCVWHQDPVTATTLYAGGRSALYKTTNSGTSWSALGTPTGTGNILEFVIAPSNNQVIYAVKAGANGVSKSTNGGTSFTAVSTGLPTTVSPTGVTVSNTDPNIVFVTYSGYGATSKVYKSTNGGTSWTNISTGLPNIPVNCIVYSNGSASDAVYVGTDLGVYYKDNSSAWIAFDAGLPNVSVRDLEIYYATGRLRAATFGRGTWDSDLYSNVPTVPVASFSANSTTICEGQSVTFTNTSSGVPTSYQWTFTGGSPASSTATNPVVTYATAGTYTVSLVATNSNGSNTSTQTNYVTVVPVSGQSLPFSEGFTGATFPPTGWTLINVDAGDTSWRLNTATGVTPTAGNSMWFDNFNVNDAGNTDEMRTPKLNFTGFSSAQLTFSVAYAAYNTTYVDGLEVAISTDCGTTWTNVYSKTGATVATGNLPTAAAQTTLFTPTSAQWRTETVSLNSYIGLNGVMLAFRNLAAYGNALYIDNINITGVAAPTAPTASFTSSPTGTACVGQTVQFTSTSTGNPTSYSWTFPSGTPATSTSQNPSVSWATPGTYTVTLVATNANGSNTTTQSIVVGANPTVTQSPIAAICATAAPITLTGGSPAGGTYSGTGVSAGTFNPGIAGAGTTTVTYTYTNASGCSATASTGITVNAAPTIASTFPASVCGSGAVTLGVTPSSGTVSWYTVATGGTAIATGNSYTTPVISTTTTYYAETTSGGCTSSRVTVVATVTSPPTVNSPGSQTFCTGTASQAIVFTGSSGSSTYSWTNDNTGYGLAATGTGNIASFTPSAAGISNVTVTPTLNGCTGTPQTFTVTVNQTPTVTMAPLTSVCANWAPVTLSGGSPAGGTYSGTGVSGGMFNPATAGSGTFPITYSYTQNGCSASAVSNITVNSCASVTEEDLQHLSLYPNPVGNILNIEGSDLSSYKLVELYDQSGRLIQRWNVSAKMTLDLSKCAAGIYAVHFVGQDTKRVERIEIVK